MIVITDGGGGKKHFSIIIYTSVDGEMVTFELKLVVVNTHLTGV